mgnify:CR=1 FL=1
MGQETKRKKPEDLRSHRWFGVEDLRAFGHRSRMRQMGYDQDDWKGRPVIGIINTWSDINQCHAHLRDRAQDVKTGVLPRTHGSAIFTRGETQALVVTTLGTDRDAQIIDVRIRQIDDANLIPHGGHDLRKLPYPFLIGSDGSSDEGNVSRQHDIAALDGSGWFDFADTAFPLGL